MQVEVARHRQRLDAFDAQQRLRHLGERAHGLDGVVVGVAARPLVGALSIGVLSIGALAIALALLTCTLGALRAPSRTVTLRRFTALGRVATLTFGAALAAAATATALALAAGVVTARRGTAGLLGIRGLGPLAGLGRTGLGRTGLGRTGF
ncbi:MAG: hypothetical protein H6838_20605 [Planctomycetes bacterium]|nr:hypothetical protein [Planctomycetota bacterium]